MSVDAVADAIIQIRSCPVAVLRQGLRGKSVSSRAVTVELLGRFQALSAIDEVVELLHNDPSAEVRARAARALGRMSSPRAVDALLARLDNGQVAMRIQAIWALGEIGDPRALPVLRDMVLQPARQMGEHAALALSVMGPKGIETLSEIAAGERGDRRRRGQGPRIALGARARLVMSPVDEEILAELFTVMDDGPPQGLVTVCDLFLTGVPDRLSEIGAALSEGRMDDASKAAHSLKGTGGAFGARLLGEVAGRLEQACRHDDSASAAALLDELHAEFLIFRDILQARLTTRSA